MLMYYVNLKLFDMYLYRCSLIRNNKAILIVTISCIIIIALLIIIPITVMKMQKKDSSVAIETTISITTLKTTIKTSIMTHAVTASDELQHTTRRKPAGKFL